MHIAKAADNDVDLTSKNGIQRSEDRGQIVENGVRPPARRGYRGLRPGGKSEKRRGNLISKHFQIIPSKSVKICGDKIQTGSI